MSALFIFRYKVDKIVRIQTQGKRMVVFRQTTTCIEFGPVALKGNFGMTIRGKKSSDSINVKIAFYSFDKLNTLLYIALSIQ